MPGLLSSLFGHSRRRPATAAAMLLLLLALVLGLLHTASGLNCYTSVDMRVKEDCQMHTGCVKRFDLRTKRTVSRGCFLSSGVNDTCGRDSDGQGVCYCHSDLCNGGGRAWPQPAAVLLSAAVAAAAAAGRARAWGGGGGA